MDRRFKVGATLEYSDFDTLVELGYEWTGDMEK